MTERTEDTEVNEPQRHSDTEGFLEQEIRRPGGYSLEEQYNS
jgi:hypothetical protein